MKKHIKKITAGIIIITILAIAFCYGIAHLSKENTRFNKDKDTSSAEQLLPSSEHFSPVAVETPLPKNSDKATALSCTLSVRCDTILENLQRLDGEKLELLPPDGIIYEERLVTFYEGESVFNLLQRELRQNNIHFEFSSTPLYDSVYIEGIANIYEFDCGELSGWMYKVNDWFPNYGCSRYELKEGDRVEWVYTCDLGADVGENYAASE